MKKHTFKIKLPASSKYLPSVRLAIAGLANQADFSVEEIEAIKNALTGALRIALDNTYAEKKGTPRLSVQCQINKRSLDLSVQNKGIQVNIKKHISV